MIKTNIVVGDLVKIKHYGIEGMFLVTKVEWNEEDGWIAMLFKVGEAKEVRGWLPANMLQRIGQKMSETNKTNKL
jgi:hypothetical protein